MDLEKILRELRFMGDQPAHRFYAMLLLIAILVATVFGARASIWLWIAMVLAGHNA